MYSIKAYYEEDEKILPCAPGRTLNETLELNLISLLNKVREAAGKIGEQKLGDTAHSVIMTKSGARGNTLNLTQMASCVGQQSVRQERIKRGYIDRTLPHFHVNDLTPRARGFVENSYRTGLRPEEFFFHSMGGREGLVDTAVRTSSSGYMQRRLVNALQDMVVENDLTVRTSEHNIIQFCYGDDGIDPAHSDAGDVINLEQVVEKTRSFKDLKENEKRIAKEMDGESHPEFPVEWFSPELIKKQAPAKVETPAKKAVEKVAPKPVEVTESVISTSKDEEEKAPKKEKLRKRNPLPLKKRKSKKQNPLLPLRKKLLQKFQLLNQ